MVDVDKNRFAYGMPRIYVYSVMGWAVVGFVSGM